MDVWVRLWTHDAYHLLHQELLTHAAPPPPKRAPWPRSKRGSAHGTHYLLLTPSLSGNTMARVETCRITSSKACAAAAWASARAGIPTQALEGHSSHLVQDTTQGLRWVLHRQRALKSERPPRSQKKCLLASPCAL